MHPAKLGLDDCGLQKIQQNLNKETQTSKAIIISDSQTSIQFPKSSTQGTDTFDKGSLTVFEFCQILQDSEYPKSVTIIKESLSEETQKHPKKPTSEEGVANRYKYCKEIIKPYLQNPSDSPRSEEKLIKDVLESVHQDFPDYQHCFENYQGNKNINSRQSSVSKIDAVTSYKCDLKPSKAKMDEKDNCKPKKTKSSFNIQQRPGCFPTDVDTASGVPDPGCDNKSDKSVKSKTSLKGANCERSAKSDKIPNCVPKKKPGPHKCDPTCEAECAYQTVDKKKSPTRLSKEECPPPIDYCRNRSEQNISKITSSDLFGKAKPISPEKKSSVTGKTENLAEPAAGKIDKNEIPQTDSQCGSLSQIKTAMEDFITKVCSTTHEAVTLIKTESARQFEMFTKFPCNESDSEDETSKPTQDINFSHKVDSQSKDDDSCNSTGPGAIIKDLVDKADSVMSKISDTIDFKKLPDAMKVKSFADSSSPYDKPTPPKEIANIIVQTNITAHTIPIPQSSNVFAAIKTKICALFCDDEKKKDSDSSSSSYSRQTEDDDEDLMERLIE